MPAALCAAGWLGRKGIYRSEVRKAGREELHLRPFLYGPEAVQPPVRCFRDNGRGGRFVPFEPKTTVMSTTDTLTSANERQNRCIALIVSTLRRYGAIELSHGGIAVRVAFATDAGRQRGPETGEGAPDYDMKNGSADQMATSVDAENIGTGGSAAAGAAKKPETEDGKTAGGTADGTADGTITGAAGPESERTRGNAAAATAGIAEPAAAYIKTMQVEEIEYAGEGSFILRMTELPDETRSRLTKKAAAALRAATEQRIVIRRDGAAHYPRIAPDELDRIREAVEAFDRS